MRYRDATVRLVHITTVPQSLNFLRGQVNHMQVRGIEVHAISSPGEDLDAFCSREHVVTCAVVMPRRVTPLADLRAVWRIYCRIRKIRPTVVHAHTPKGGLLGTVAAWLARAPVRVYHMRGLPFVTATNPKRLLLRWTEKVACALAHRVICVSHSLRAVAISERLCSPEKIKVLMGGSGQGVDAAGRFDPAQQPEGTRQNIRKRFDIPADAVVLGFVGRVVRDKGVVELVEALLALRAEFPALHLLLVGPFEPQDPVPAGIERVLREDPFVHLAGMDWNTPPFYAAMDLVALPTYREGFPNVPLEAASMELPVIATRIPGCVDAVVDGATGTLVPPRDSHALAEAIRTYLRDPALRRRHGEVGRKRVMREFRQEAIWGALYQEYVSLLRDRGVVIPRVQ